MLSPQDVVSYREMCDLYGISLQRGMNFRIRNSESLILMSIRPGAPYEDRVEQGGRVVVYEGHDAPRRKGGPDPNFIDQPESRRMVDSRRMVSSSMQCGDTNLVKHQPSRCGCLRRSEMASGPTTAFSC
jgi:hypothetical protein